MNRLFIAAVGTLVCLGAHAEGYQVNTLSARQQGMGETGVSQVLGAESLIFNPAAVSLMEGTTSLSASLSGISATANCWYEGTKYTTSNKVSTPFNISAAFRINETMAAGVSIYTPYGSSINWGLNWPGAVLNQAVDLKVFTIQPTFSWKITPKFSVGAGLMIGWGSVDLKKGLVAASSFDKLLGLMVATNQLPAFQAYDKVSPASANLTGSTGLSYGVNVGVLYQPDQQWSVGASFRTKLNMHVKKGDVVVNYADTQSSMLLESYLKNLNYTNFDASMPCPYVLTAGVSYRASERVLLAFDAQLNGWGTYKQLDITFAEQEAFDQHLVKDYHNAMTYHAGVEVKATQRLDARAGLMVDTSPCNTDYYNPETPGATKIEPSIGLSFRPLQGLSVDLSLMYVYGTKVKGATGQYSDFVAPIYNQALQQYDQALSQYGMSSGLEPLPTVGEIKADYQVHAIIPAIGISYTF